MINTLKKVGAVSFMNAGDNVQLSQSGTVTAPDNSQVEVIRFSVPETGKIRISYYLFETGSTTYRKAVGNLKVNGSTVHQDFTSSEGASSKTVTHDIDVFKDDIVQLTVQVQNSEQSPYIDANINNFWVGTLETRTITFTVL